VLEGLIRIRIRDTASNTLITKAAQLSSGLFQMSAHAWELEQPLIIKPKEQLEITVDNVVADFVLTSATVPTTQVTVGNIRVSLNLEGQMLFAAPEKE